jgi:hypothetical protein
MSPRNLEREARVLILLLLPLVPPSRASPDVGLAARFGPNGAPHMQVNGIPSAR